MPPMARTNRNSGSNDDTPPPPSLDAAALDNLDLDDMFADDNDLFSDELDIDLDGIGTMDGGAAPTTKAASPPPPVPQRPPSPAAPSASSKRKGPKTKRPPPADPPPPTSSKSKLTKNTKASAAAAAAAAAVEPKRRKTKRKTKTPAFWDDGDYVEEAVVAPKAKKRRGGSKDAGSKTPTATVVPVVPVVAPVATTTTTTSSKSTTKKGGTTTKTKKKKGSATAVTADDASAASSVKSSASPNTKKSKVKGGASSSSMPPPISRQGSVAAAGQFGGRKMRGMAGGLPLHKSGSAGGGSSKTKRKSSSSTTPSSAGGDSPSAPPNKIRRTESNSSQSSALPKSTGGGSLASSSTPATPAPPGPPKPEPTFCGLRPSRVQFYPFMAALPSEPGIKNRKAFPMLEKISTTLAQQLNNATGTTTTTPASASSTAAPAGGAGSTSGVPSASGGKATGKGGKVLNHAKQKASSAATSDSGGGGNGGGGAPNPDDMALAVSESEAIYKLILETYEMTEKDKATFGPDKRIALGLAIGHVRKYILELEKPKLVTDLYRICGLLKRQYGFLKQNLQNMHHWCHDNFSHEDYQATYGPPELASATTAEAAKLGTVVPGTGAPGTLARNSVLKGLTSRLLRIKIKGVSGFKDPKVPLRALLPPHVISSSPFNTMSSNASLGSTSSTVASTNKKSKKRKDSIASIKSSASPASAASLSAAAAAAKAGSQHSQLQPSTSVAQQLAAAAATRAATRKPTPYADARPEIRRQRLMDQVMAWASKLEGSHSQMMELRSRQIGKRAHEVRKLVHIDTDHDDPELLPALHTQLMWKVLDAAGYLSPPATTFGMPNSISSNTNSGTNNISVLSAPPGTTSPGMAGLLTSGANGGSRGGGGGGGTSVGSNHALMPGGAASLPASLSSSTAVRKWNVDTSLFDDWLKVAWCPEINPRGLLQPKTPRRVKGVMTTTSTSSTLKEELRKLWKEDAMKDDMEGTKESANKEDTSTTGRIPDMKSTDVAKVPSTDIVVEEEEEADPTVPIPSISDSLFNRLQSLLVEEEDSELDEDDEEDSDSDSDDESDADESIEKEKRVDVDVEMEIIEDNDKEMKKEDDEEDSLEVFLGKNGDDDDDLERALEITNAIVPGRDYNGEKLHQSRQRNVPQIADLSSLTLEERTFLHLRFAGLVQQSIFPREVELDFVVVPEYSTDKQAKGNPNDMDVEKVEKLGKPSDTQPEMTTPSVVDDNDKDVDKSATSDRSPTKTATAETVAAQEAPEATAAAMDKSATSDRLPTKTATAETVAAQEAPEATPSAMVLDADNDGKQESPEATTSAMVLDADNDGKQESPEATTAAMVLDADNDGKQESPEATTSAMVLDADNGGKTSGMGQKDNDRKTTGLDQTEDTASVPATKVSDPSPTPVTEVVKDNDEKKPTTIAATVNSTTPPTTTSSNNTVTAKNVVVAVVDEEEEKNGVKNNPANDVDADYHDYDVDYTEDHLEDEMSYVINSMGADLSRLTKTNNARVSFLQSSGHALAVQGHYGKLHQDEQSSLISRCQAVLKKSKEHKAKSARLKQQQQQQSQQGHNRKQGPSSSSVTSNNVNKSKEEYNLPW